MEKASVRLAEVLAALALATDLGMGQPSGHAMQTAVLSVRLANALNLPPQDVADVFYVALLRYIGCTADAPEVARLAGDEIALAAAVGPYVMGGVADRVGHTAVANPEETMATAMAVHCEAAGLLGARLGLGGRVTAALHHAFERWDGRGHPGRLTATEVPEPTRIAVLARDVLLWQRLAGSGAARSMAARRRGHAYDPRAVDAYLALPDPPGEASWPEYLAAEPQPQAVAGERDLDNLLEAFADFADLKTPFALGHSRQVAALAAGAGMVLGLDGPAIDDLRRAGLLHDLGRTGISSRIWGKAEPLSDAEWERVRLHPYLTERILRRCSPLAGLANLAGSHHERLDGSGYHRGLTAASLDQSARVLAAADAYVSLREARPDRSAHSSAETLHLLQADVQRGPLDGAAVSAVVSAAGEERPPPPHWPGGLSDREVQVLRLAVRGLTIGQVATRLGIAPKTVDRHLQNGYAKIGVSSRAGAALFAMQNGLLH